MISNITLKVISALSLSLVFILQGCGGGGGGGSDSGSNGGELQTPIGDVSGYWEIEERVDARECGQGEYFDYGYYDVSQSGNSITVSNDDGSYTGSISGSRITWSGSFPDDGGMTQSSVSLTISSDCQTLSGSADWSWSDGQFSCSGTTSVSGERYEQYGCRSAGRPALQAPGNLIATATLPGAINLDWIGSDDPTTSFVLQRSGSADGGFANIASIAAGRGAYVDKTGIAAGETYHYRLYAQADGARSDFSAATFATALIGRTPNAPTQLQANAVAINSAHFTWFDNSAIEDGFVVEAGTYSAGGPFNEIARLQAGATELTASLSPGTTYFVRVAAFNADGNSIYSNTVEIRTADAAPVED